MAVFLPAFLQLAVSGALLLYMTCLLSSQQPMHSTVLLYAGAVSKTFTTQHMYKATWMLLTNKCFLLIFLTYIKVIYFRTSTLFHLFSSSWSVNNSLLSSSVMLSVSDLAMPSSFLSFPLKAATMSFPLWVKTLKSLLNGISHSATILWLSSHQCMGMEILVLCKFIWIRCEGVCCYTRKRCCHTLFWPNIST